MPDLSEPEPERRILSPQVSLQAQLAKRVKDAIEVVADSDGLMWCANRIAELRRNGDKATARIAWKKEGDRFKFMPCVRTHDGKIERPPA